MILTKDLLDKRVLVQRHGSVLPAIVCEISPSGEYFCLLYDKLGTEWVPSTFEVIEILPDLPSDYESFLVKWVNHFADKHEHPPLVIGRRYMYKDVLYTLAGQLDENTQVWLRSRNSFNCILVSKYEITWVKEDLKDAN